MCVRNCEGDPGGGCCGGPEGGENALWPGMVRECQSLTALSLSSPHLLDNARGPIDHFFNGPIRMPGRLGQHLDLQVLLEILIL